MNGREGTTKTMLVCGPAACVHDDMARADRAGAKIMAVNYAAAIVRADYLFSAHFEVMHRFIAAQRALLGERGLGPGSEMPFETVSALPQYGIFRPDSLPINHWHAIPERMATSGWSAIYAAANLGAEEIILCGIPLDSAVPAATGAASAISSHHPDGPTMARIRKHARRYVEDFPARLPGYRVHSMSGFTRDVLGMPEDVLDLSDDNERGSHGREQERSERA